MGWYQETGAREIAWPIGRKGHSLCVRVKGFLTLCTSC